jgi:hypothetical protein
MTLTKLQWTPNAANTDGSALTQAQLAALTFTAFIDTVTPPVKAYPVPPGKVTPIANPVAGGPTVQVLFSDIGFTPADGVQYYADITESELQADGTLTTSAPSTIAPFVQVGTPGAPTNFTVA